MSPMSRPHSPGAVRTWPSGASGSLGVGSFGAEPPLFPAVPGVGAVGLPAAGTPPLREEGGAPQAPATARATAGRRGRRGARTYFLSDKNPYFLILKMRAQKAPPRSPLTRSGPLG